MTVERRPPIATVRAPSEKRTAPLRSELEYCKLDTLVTLLVYLSWGRHAGWVPPDAYDRAMAGARACVERQAHSGWRGVSW